MVWTRHEARTILDKIVYVPAKYQWEGHTEDLIVMHDMEAPEDKATTAEAVANYFKNPPRTSSAHLNCDKDSTVCSVKPWRRAAHAPGANHNGIGIEQAGYARQSRAEWLDADSTAVLKQSSRAAALCCVAFDIPARWLTNAELKAGKRGLVHHLQCSQVFGGSHWDCGYSWPSDVFMSFVWNWMDHPNNPADLPEEKQHMGFLLQSIDGPWRNHVWHCAGGTISYFEDFNQVPFLVRIGALIDGNVRRCNQVELEYFAKVGAYPPPLAA